MKFLSTARSDTIRFCTLVLALLLASIAHGKETVSFVAVVQPHSDQTGFNLMIGNQQVPSSMLNDMLRPGGGHMLRVTSIKAHLINSQPMPGDSDYALVFLGAVTTRPSVRGFGAGSISVSGAATAQVNFDPGLFVQLGGNESLTVRSQLQSNETAHIEVHGYLESD